MTMYNLIRYEIHGGKKHVISWDLKFHLKDTPRVMRSVAKNSSESYFQIKIEILKDNNDEINILIYFLYPIATYIKCDLVYTQALRGSVTMYNSDYKMNFPNEWDYLGSLDRKNFKVLQWALGHYVTFNLKFEFNIIDKNNSFFEKMRPIANVNKFYNTNKFTDVVIQSADGKELKVHKLILASASEVFKAHFEHNTTECHTNIIKCQFESDVLEAILSYIYNGDNIAVNKITEAHLCAADFYQLLELKVLCERALSKNLTAQNVLRMLDIAYSCNAESLTQSALEFIKSESPHSFLETEDWDNFKSVHTLKLIIEYLKTSKEVILVYHDLCYGSATLQKEKPKDPN